MRYLLCVDGGEPASNAASFLWKLVRPGDVVFIAFVQPELSFGEALLGSREELLAKRASELETLEARFLNSFSAAKTQGVEVRFDGYTGDARTILLQQATDRQVDAVVVGHRRLSGLERALTFGSVSDHLVRHAHCSVLVV